MLKKRFPRPRQSWGRQSWLQPYCVTLLVLTLCYVLIGIPGQDADTSQTDRVDPLNSWIWLGFLASSMPVLRQRWRPVLALVLGNRLLLVVLLYFALSVTWALDPGASMRRLLFTVLQLVLFAILISGIRHPPVLHLVIAAVCAVAAFADLVAWIVAPGYAMAEDGLAGLQSQKNVTGMLMMYGCLSSVPAIFLVRRRLWRGTFAAAAVMMAILLVATRSTTSQSVVISAVVVMPMVLLVARQRTGLILAIATAVLLTLAGAMLGYIAWCGLTQTDPLLPLRHATFSARTDIWWFVIDEIHKRPLLGAGYGSFWSINPAVQPSLKTDQWFGVYAIINEGHNGYLDLLATGGMIGFVGGLSVLFRGIGIAACAVARIPTSLRSAQATSLAYPTAAFHLTFLLGLIVHNFTESNLFSNNFLLSVGFLICLLDLEKWRLGSRVVVPRLRPKPIAATAIR